jgi:hypothetical protein
MLPSIKLMTRRTALMLVLFTLIALPSFPQSGFAQSDPFLGIWQLNLAKSDYPRPPPKSQTMYIWEDEAKKRQNSQVTIGADGVPAAVVFTHTYDDTPRPTPGARGYDASAYARPDARTINARYLNAGTLIGTAAWTVSPDGKTLTMAVANIAADGQRTNEVRIYDKQQ